MYFRDNAKLHVGHDCSTARRSTYMLAVIAAVLIELADTPAPVDSPTPADAIPFKLAIPPGWHRTESGMFNEWQDDAHTGNFRVTPMSSNKAFQGPGAADAVKAMFIEIANVVHPNPNVTVKTVSVCNGTRKAYRLDDSMGI